MPETGQRLARSFHAALQPDPRQNQLRLLRLERVTSALVIGAQLLRAGQDLVPGPQRLEVEELYGRAHAGAQFRHELFYAAGFSEQCRLRLRGPAEVACGGEQIGALRQERLAQDPAQPTREFGTLPRT